MTRKALIAVALVLVAGVGTYQAESSHATILIKKNLGQLAAESELIVVGRITGKSCNWAHGLILSHHTLEVERTLKGKAPAQLVVTEVGGTVGDTTMRVESAATYAPGQRVLVHLKKGPRGYWRTLGWIQGRYAVVHNRASDEDVVRLETGLEYVTSAYFPRLRTVELDEFCEKVEELVAVAAKKKAALEAAEKEEKGR